MFWVEYSEYVSIFLRKIGVPYNYGKQVILKRKWVDTVGGVKTEPPNLTCPLISTSIKIVLQLKKYQINRQQNVTCLCINNNNLIINYNDFTMSSICITINVTFLFILLFYYLRVKDGLQCLK